MKMAESPSKWEENTVGKGEIARDEQFLLFPLCFQNTCTADTKNQGLFGKRLTKRQKKTRPVQFESNCRRQTKICSK